MKAQDPPPGGDPIRQIRWPLRLTRAGMVAEEVTFAFWPLWTLLLACLTSVGFGFFDWAPVELFWAAALLVPAAGLWALARGVRRFRWPRRADALARLDATLAGRPLAALSDRQAIGAGDPAARAVWRAHLRRMADRARAARPVAPDLNLAVRDPFALRHLAMTGLVMAALFGSWWVGGGPMAPGAGRAAMASASWEGWVTPPAYTGKPAIYLSADSGTALTLPAGSRVLFRLYDPDRTLTLTQTVGRPTAAAPGGDAPSVTLDFTADKTGRITLAPAGDGAVPLRDWQVTVLPDLPPTIRLTGPMERMADGSMRQPFEARDDYGVTGGKARFELDLAAIDRRFGLAAEPEPRPALTLDLPRPLRGRRGADLTGVLAEDASEHPWSGLPVRMTLTASDAAGQTGTTEGLQLILPGRRFFDPLAAAVIEQRRDLLWSRANGPRVAVALRAVTNRPDRFITNDRVYLALRTAIRQIEGAGAAMVPELRDELAKALWDTAVLIEDGGLDDALAQMQQAQQRLSEAIRNGASKDEIRKLTDDLRRATDEYLKKLAEQGQRDPAERFTKNQPQREITQDQLQKMMDDIQKLMEQGRMDEAQEKLDQLNELMQNLRVTEGQSGQGGNSPGGKAMRDLHQTLRDQQALSDDVFRQNQGGQGSDPGDQGTSPDGQAPQPGGSGDGNGSGARGQDGDSGAGDDLAARQRALRQALGRAQEALPDLPGDQADQAQKSLDQAGRAMDQAEEALRGQDLSQAIDRQAEAIEKLREGARGLDQALAEINEGQPSTEGGQQQAQGRRTPSRDPLGRADGADGTLNDTTSDLTGRGDVYRRALDLMDDIRRRADDRTRPEAERGYLGRLLGGR